ARTVQPPAGLAGLDPGTTVVPATVPGMAERSSRTTVLVRRVSAVLELKCAVVQPEPFTENRGGPIQHRRLAATGGGSNLVSPAVDDATCWRGGRAVVGRPPVAVAGLHRSRSACERPLALGDGASLRHALEKPMRSLPQPGESPR